MDALNLEIGQIAELATQVAVHGTIGGADMVSTDIFEMVVAIALVVHQIWPG